MQEADGAAEEAAEGAAEEVEPTNYYSDEDFSGLYRVQVGGGTNPGEEWLSTDD